MGEGGPDDKLPCPTLGPALRPAPPLSGQTRQAGLGEGLAPERLRPSQGSWSPECLDVKLPGRLKEQPAV